MAEVRLHVDAQKAFDALAPPQRKALLAWAKALEKEPTAGDQVKRSRMPRGLMRRHALTNLWRIPLVEGWRALYTLEAAPGQSYVIILTVLDHKEYDRLFGYATS